MGRGWCWSDLVTATNCVMSVSGRGWERRWIPQDAEEGLWRRSLLVATAWSVYTSNCVIMEPTLIWLSANLIYTRCHNTALTRHLALTLVQVPLLTLRYMWYLDILDSSTKMGQCLSNFSAVYNQNWSPEPQLDTNLIKDQSKLWWLLLSLGGHWAVLVTLSPPQH